MSTFEKTDLCEIDWESAYRVIPAQYPPLNIFESYHDSAEDLELAMEIEALTNPELLNQVGDLAVLPKHEWIYGEGASWVMCAFTHYGKSSCFSDGSYGVYYAANSVETAVEETKYHWMKFLCATNEPDLKRTMRVLVNNVRKPMLNVFPESYKALLDADSYIASQSFAKEKREENEWGIYYPSVRKSGGECVAVFRPRALTLASQLNLLDYIWDGATQEITKVVDRRLV